MNRLVALLQANWQVVLAVLAGAAVVFIVGITTDNMTAVLFTGFVVGIFVGGLVTTLTRDKDNRH